MESTHLVQLSQISIDVTFIRCINWNAPVGIVLYLRDAESASGATSNLVIDKTSASYQNDKDALAIAVGRYRADKKPLDYDEGHPIWMP